MLCVEQGQRATAVTSGACVCVCVCGGGGIAGALCDAVAAGKGSDTTPWALRLSSGIESLGMTNMNLGTLLLHTAPTDGQASDAARAAAVCAGGCVARWHARLIDCRRVALALRARCVMLCVRRFDGHWH